ncbi:MAG: TrkH family potassium uptake protein [Lachnospiraceae bacterium]|nr:TrkH family potassium uptake protein [Lachnospiraceae bacterium]
MNFKSLSHFTGLILFVEAVLMLPAFILSLIFREPGSADAYLQTLLIIVILGALLWLLSRGEKANDFYEKEGLACAGISWLVLGLTGALPFFFSGQIPSYIDALFETVSGFTTTGASILPEVESMDKSLLYWRSFTHWIGGMGVLVFLLALVPRSRHGAGFTVHILRAESPGPDVGKLVPQLRKTAQLLYLIYIGLTAVDIILLALDMPLFDAFCIAFGTAGTGGFAVTNAGLGGYSPYIQWVTTIFMFLFGVNFSCYYLLLKKRPGSVIRDEELHTYLAVFLGAGLIIAFSVRSYFGGWEETLRHSFFQAASIMSTTGFATTDFNLWTTLAKGILVFLMILGASAGSTGGGLKCIRLNLIVKDLRSNLREMIRPGRIYPVRSNGRPVNQSVLTSLRTYLAAYVLIVLTSFLILCIDGRDLTTSITAVLACFNNIGPGLSEVGPMGNYGSLSVLSKLVLIFDMLAGRLEIFPMIALISRTTWRHE